MLEGVPTTCCFVVRGPIINTGVISYQHPIRVKLYKKGIKVRVCELGTVLGLASTVFESLSAVQVQYPSVKSL